MLLADAAESSAPLWLQWNLDPKLVLGIALFAGAYFYALGPLRRKYGWSDAVDRRKVAYFVAGTILLFLALCSPLDTLGDEYLFSAHMVQHMLISLVCPPLWLLGTPEWMLAPLFRRKNVTRVMRWLTNPIVAFGVFNADIWLWHAPALYDATLVNDNIHILEHLSFIVFGVLFWWPVLSPVRQIPRISRGFGVLYMFMACQPMVALGALLTFAAHPLYQPYVVAPRIWGSTPLGDQQLGGLIMWLPSNVPYVIALSAMFIQWVSEHDRAEREAAGEFDDFYDPNAALTVATDVAASDPAVSAAASATEE